MIMKRTLHTFKVNLNPEVHRSSDALMNAIIAQRPIVSIYYANDMGHLWIDSIKVWDDDHFINREILQAVRGFKVESFFKDLVVKENAKRMIASKSKAEA